MSLSAVCLGEFMLSLSVSVLATLEVYSFSSSLTRGDPDLSHGLQVRRWFMAAVGSASGARAIGDVLELLYSYLCRSLLLVTPNPGVLSSLRILPSLPYFTMYSLLTVYMAQLCYTVNGLPFFHVRNMWFFSNFSLYLVVVISILFFFGSDYAYGAFFVAYLLNLVMFTFYGTSVFKVIPTQTSGGARGLAPNKKPVVVPIPALNAASTSASTARILARLWPFVVVCCVGVCLSSLNFLLMACKVLTPSQDIVEIVLAIFSEVVPSIAFLYLMPKLENSFDEPSLLSMVVRATSPYSTRPEGYGLVGGDSSSTQYGTTV